MYLKPWAAEAAQIITDFYIDYLNCINVTEAAGSVTFAVLLFTVTPEAQLYVCEVDATLFYPPIYNIRFFNYLL